MSVSFFTPSCPVSPLLAQSRCGQAVLASSLIDNSQQGPSQGGRPDSLPPNTPGRLRAVVQAVNHRQLYRHHQALTGSYLPTAQISFSHWKACRRAYTCSRGTNSQALSSPALIHVNELLPSAKNNTFSLIATHLSSTVEVWSKVQDRFFYLYISFSRFLSIDQIRVHSPGACKMKGGSKRSDAVKLDALTSVWRVSLCRML